MIRVALADDHPIMRQGLARLIAAQPDMRVVCEAENGRQALQALELYQVDVLVLDMAMPRVNGVEVLRRVSEVHPRVRVVMLSMFPAEHHEAKVMRLGAAAYVTKAAPTDEVLRAIRATATGERWQSTEASTPDRAEPHHALSAREYQVFTLLVQGLPVSEIAAELDLSSSTISNHLARVRDKLGVRTIAEIVRYAIDVGLAGSNPPK